MRRAAAGPPLGAGGGPELAAFFAYARLLAASCGAPPSDAGGGTGAAEGTGRSERVPRRVRALEEVGGFYLVADPERGLRCHSYGSARALGRLIAGVEARIARTLGIDAADLGAAGFGPARSAGSTPGSPAPSTPGQWGRAVLDDPDDAAVLPKVRPGERPRRVRDAAPGAPAPPAPPASTAAPPGTTSRRPPSRGLGR